MSVVIGIKDTDKVIFGADTQTTTGSLKNDLGSKIWKYDGCGFIFGAVGDVRTTQMIRYSDKFRNVFMEADNADTSFMASKAVPAIIGILKDNEYELVRKDSEDNYPSMDDVLILIGYKNRIWEIHNNFTVEEIRDYVAIGSGDEIALGSLYTSSRCHNPKKKIETAIKAASIHTIYVNDKIQYLETENHI